MCGVSMSRAVSSRARGKQLTTRFCPKVFQSLLHIIYELLSRFCPKVFPKAANPVYGVNTCTSVGIFVSILLYIYIPYNRGSKTRVLQVNVSYPEAKPQWKDSVS